MQTPPAERGRGAGVSPANRFEPIHLEVLGDTLDERLANGDAPAPTPTQPMSERARSIINRVDSPDLKFRWSINPYRGCEHGCVYCYARPTHETLGFSSGLDFETKIVAKTNAPELLATELDHSSWRGEPIMMSGVTDAYQPLERRFEITRRCLQVMAERRQPVSIVTKNRLILRDLDLLADLARDGASSVAISLTTLDHTLARAMEPRASSPGDRLETMRRLSAAGVPVMVMTAPMIPGLNDHELPALLRAASDAGATSAAMAMLRLPYEVKSVFADWLERACPDRAARVLGAIRDVRDGELSDSRFGSRLRGAGPRAEQLRSVFEVFRTRYRLDTPAAAPSSDAFRRRRERRRGPTLFDSTE